MWACDPCRDDRYDEEVERVGDVLVEEVCKLGHGEELQWTSCGGCGEDGREKWKGLFELATLKRLRRGKAPLSASVPVPCSCRVEEAYRKVDAVYNTADNTQENRSEG